MTTTVLYLRAISAFLNNRDVNSAIGYLKKIRDKNNGLWHHNMAFLYGYRGDLKVASRHYRLAALHALETMAIGQIEDFICWVLEQEPEKYQLNFCLGLFNWKTKGDFTQAQIDFTTFLNKVPSGVYTKEQELARKWIDELQGLEK